MPNYTKKNIHLIINRICKTTKKLRSQNVECIYKTAENRLQKTQKIHKTNLNSSIAIREKPNA